MSPDKQRIAIAEACGWGYHDRHPIYGKQSVKSWYYRDTDTTVSHESRLPDYLHDLNAMHEAEQYLWGRDWDARDTFVNYLSRIIDPIHGYRNQGGVDLLDATAAQRAEAFLRTLGKWEDSK